MAETSYSYVVAIDSLLLLLAENVALCTRRQSRCIVFFLVNPSLSFSMPCHSPVFCRNVSPLCRNSWDPSVPLMSLSPWSFSALLRSLVCLVPRKGSVRRWPWFGRGKDRCVTYSSQRTQDCTSHQWRNHPGEGVRRVHAHGGEGREVCDGNLLRLHFSLVRIAFICASSTASCVSSLPTLSASCVSSLPTLSAS